jgi:hypothetical protein
MGRLLVLIHQPFLDCRLGKGPVAPSMPAHHPIPHCQPIILSVVVDEGRCMGFTELESYDRPQPTSGPYLYPHPSLPLEVLSAACAARATITAADG